MLFPVVCCNGLQGLKMDSLKLTPTTRYRTDSNQTSTRLLQIIEVTIEEGDFEVVYDRTCMTMSKDPDWCVSGSIELVSYHGYTT